MDARVLEARLDLMEAEARLLLAHLRDLRLELLPPEVPPAVDLLVCGHPRDNAVTVSSLDQPGSSLLCRACGAVEARP